MASRRTGTSGALLPEAAATPAATAATAAATTAAGVRARMVVVVETAANANGASPVATTLLATLQ